APGALPARHGRRKHIREAKQETGLVRDQPVLEQAEQLLLALIAVDVMEEFQRRLGAPTEEEAGESVCCRPLQDVCDIRPESLLLHPVLQRIDAGYDETVELLAPDISKGAVEFADMVRWRVVS